jgi:hypothetical protein
MIYHEDTKDTKILFLWLSACPLFTRVPNIELRSVCPSVPPGERVVSGYYRGTGELHRNDEKSTAGLRTDLRHQLTGYHLRALRVFVVKIFADLVVQSAAGR